jgi:2-keto-4-pentenoate hydratase/2-oxohepta-3-ene-1,7-dioic acid hydratase in catechol pathway
MSRIQFSTSAVSLPVGKILCLGRNYAEHVREMDAPLPESPVVFLKPATAIIHEGESIIIPPISNDVHHEVEMVIVIGTGGRDIAIPDAYNYIAGYAVGLDMTLRDVQADAKKKGLPWSIAKGFDTSAPVSLAVERERVTDPHNLMLSLRVNGRERQRSSTAKMIFRVDFLVSYLSSLFTLERGDLIYTGTPEGVGPVHAGDILEAELESVGTLRVGVALKHAAAGV